MSTGLACTIVILLWVTDELNVDKFHTNDQHLFRIYSNFDENGEMTTEEGLPPLLSKAMQDEIPDVKLGASSSSPSNYHSLTSEDIYLNATGRFVTNNFFQLFSFEMLEGNTEQLFPNKNGIIISESLAEKFYGSTENVLGKIIIRGDIESVICGISKDVPKNSTIQFDYLLPFERYVDFIGQQHIWQNYVAETYVLTHKEIDINNFNKKIDGFLMAKNGSDDDHLWAQQYTSKYLHGDYKNGQVVGGRITYVRLFSLIALFILLIACINFMNLSTANATKKFKEVGVKKTIGANRQTLIFQYLGESMMLSFLACLLYTSPSPRDATLSRMPSSA